ncbi:MAG: succinate dehydrogenase iron-sulfur subunit [Syntrophobacteraceae bacterium]|nr:succinate dehydrogenase iron-sulfur subunit [Syntrophobacteraceae bacterium]
MPRFRIARFDPESDKETWYKTYEVEAMPRDRILDCLNRIKWEQDGTLGYRMSCAHGVCGSDGMRINGVCALACQKLVKDYGDAEEITLEPLPFFTVRKDLIVDMDDFLERIGSMSPYLVRAKNPPEKESLQSPEEHRKVQDVIRCILCGCCTSACPVMRENPDYVGPAALVWAYRYLYDSRDGDFLKRLEKLNEPDGVWPCENFFECTRVCPKEIPVTKSINFMKREIKKHELP